jgi:hypothetical protein
MHSNAEKAVAFAKAGNAILNESAVGVNGDV